MNLLLKTILNSPKLADARRAINAAAHVEYRRHDILDVTCAAVRLRKSEPRYVYSCGCGFAIHDTPPASDRVPHVAVAVDGGIQLGGFWA